ncbi:MAG: hypothetical protein MJ252_09095, partial [archaeon]|nr:hypothetical protein [archaeon]
NFQNQGAPMPFDPNAQQKQDDFPHTYQPNKPEDDFPHTYQPNIENANQQNVPQNNSNNNQQNNQQIVPQNNSNNNRQNNQQNVPQNNSNNNPPNQQNNQQNVPQNNPPNQQNNQQNPQPNGAENRPEIILIDESKLSTLLNLLDIYDNRNISDSVWSIIGIIDIPKNLIESIYKMDINTANLISNKGLLMLNLRIILSCIYGVEDPSMELNKSAKAFNFIQEGGEPFDKVCWTEAFISQKLPQKFLIDALIQLIGEQSFNSMSILIIRNILFLLEQFLLKTIQLCLKDGRPPSKYYDEVLKQITEENKKNKKLLDFEFKKMTALNSLLDMLEESHLIRIIFNYLEMNSQIEKNNEGNMNQNNPCAIYHSPIVNEDLFNISMDIMQLLLCIRDFKSEFAEAELKQSVLIKYLFHPIQGIRQRTKELFVSIDKHLFTFKIKDSVILNENEVKQIHEKWQQERQNQHSNQVEAGNNFICGYTVLDFLVKLTKNMSDLFFFKKGRNGEFLSLFYLLLKNYSEKINNDRIINLGPMIDNIINKILVPLQCEEIKTELGQENLAELLTFFSDIIKIGKEPLVYTILEEAFKKNGILLISALYSSLFILNNNNSGGNNFSNNSKPIISNFAYTNSKLRQSSYNLILTLTDYDDDYKTFFYSKIMSHHLEFNTSKSIREDIDIPIKKDSEDYVGLQNFGATCYLNSLFQQLFMNPQFFGSIFEFNIPPEKRDTSIIYQMQRAFMSLKLSIKKYYPLRKFIHSIPKAFNSEPINVHIQQDSDEFLSILLDLLEKEAKEFGKENFLEESFKGKISNEIVSMEKDFPYYSTTEEDFYRITVDIKNHRSLEEALDFFVKGEVLDGDNQIYVEKYKRKIPVRKRSTLKKMSTNLIVQLKRFELDYTTFTNYKLNDYISFPKKICFKKYTRAFINNQEQLISGQRQSEVKLEDYETDNLSDEKTTYILTGILIHSGSTLQSGHYYSFIMDQMKGHWRRFDDVSVRNFEESQIEKECFGDEKIGQNSNVNALGSGINGQSTSYQRCQNAYLLFYTREDRFNANRSISDDNLWSYMNGQKGELVTDVIKENSEYVIMKNYIQDEYIDFILNFWRKVKGNHSQINQPNYKCFSKEKKKEFEIGKVLFNYLFKNQGLKKENLPLTINPPNAAEMYKKCKDEVEDSLAAINSNNNLSKSRNHQEVQYEDYRTIKFLFRFFYSIVLTFVPKKVPLVAKLLTAEIKKYYSIASWFLRKLEKNPNELFINYIFNSEVMDIRTELSNLVLESIKYCAKKDKEIGAFYLETPYAEYDERNQAIIGKLYQQGLSLRFIETVLYENFKRIYTTYPKNKEYLDLLVNIITNLPESVKITKDYFKYIINYICNNSYGDVAKEFPNLRVVPPNRNIYFDSMPAISLLSIFVQGCLTPGIKQSRQLAPGCIMIPRQSEEYYTKLPKDWENILIKEFLIDSVLNISISPYVIVDFEENKKRMGYQFTPQMKLLSHICFEDNDTSIKVIETILKAIGDFDHNNLRVIYNSLFSLSAVMELNDNVRETRYLALFNLFENKDVFGGIPLFDFLCTSEGNEASALIILYTLGVILNRNIEIMHFMNSRINDFSSFPILWERLTSQEMKETLINNLTTLGLDLNDVLAECYEVYINQLKLNQIQRGDFNLF